MWEMPHANSRSYKTRWIQKLSNKDSAISSMSTDIKNKIMVRFPRYFVKFSRSFTVKNCLWVEALFTFYIIYFSFYFRFLRLKGHLTLVIMPRGQTKLKSKPNSFFPRFIAHSISFSYKKCHLLSQSFPIFAYEKCENKRLS